MNLSELSIQTVGLEAHIERARGFYILWSGIHFQSKNKNLSLGWMLTK